MRFSAEWDALHAMERVSLGTRVNFGGEDAVTPRRQVLSRSVLLSRSMAPRAHAMLDLAVARLGVSDSVELYQKDEKFDSARLALSDPIGIEFLGDYLAKLDDGGLLAVIGHEIGHCLAQSRNPTFAWALSTSQSGTLPALRSYAMAAEITADRFGLLACRDIDAVLRLEMSSAAGMSTGIRFDVDAYLEQAKSMINDLARSGGKVVGSTHPEHYVRAYAEWLFSESDVYAELTGTGAGTRRLADVDERLRALLGIRRATDPEPPPPVPAPRVSGVGRAETWLDEPLTPQETFSRFLSETMGRFRTRQPPAPPPRPAPGLLSDFQEHVRRQKERGSS